MDPIANINIKKDSSFAMLLEAQRRGYELHYMEMADPVSYTHLPPAWSVVHRVRPLTKANP